MFHSSPPPELDRDKVLRRLATTTGIRVHAPRVLDEAGKAAWAKRKKRRKSARRARRNNR